MEQFYAAGRWGCVIPLPEKTHFCMIKGANDIRRYAAGGTDDDDFIQVYRGYPGMLVPV